MGWVCRWWETVTLPVDVDPSDEQEFRNQIKEIAFQVSFPLSSFLLLPHGACRLSLFVYTYMRLKKNKILQIVLHSNPSNGNVVYSATFS